MIVDLEALPVQAKFLTLSSLRRITDGDVQRGCRLQDGSDDGIKNSNFDSAEATFDCLPLTLLLRPPRYALRASATLVAAKGKRTRPPAVVQQHGISWDNVNA